MSYVSVAHGWLCIILAVLTWGLPGSRLGAAAPPPPTNAQPAYILEWPASYTRLTWNSVTEASGYNVYRYDTGTTSWVQAAAGVTNLFSTDANYGTLPADYYVTAVTPEGESAPSTVVTAQEVYPQSTLYLSPIEPWNGLSSTSAVVRWTVSLVSGADGMLELGTSPTQLTLVGYHPEYQGFHSFPLTGLIPGTHYYYRLTSVERSRGGQIGRASCRERV